MNSLKLIVQNVNTKVVFVQPLQRTVNDTIKVRVKDAVSYYPKGYKYTNVYKKGLWDGRKSLYNHFSDSFPTGLLPAVLKNLDNAQVSYTLEDRRVRPPLAGDGYELNGITLRDYQVEAVARALEAGRGILDMSVGSGKTEIACSLIKAIGRRTLFIVHLKTLLIQTVERLKERLGVEPAVFGFGSAEFGDITVATIQSLHRYLPDITQYLKEFDVVIADEAHHIGDNTFMEVLSKIPAYYRFGLSGSPLDRTDGGSLYTIGALGDVIYQVQPSELIEQGVLVKPKVLVIPISSFNTSVYKNKTEFDQINDWNELYEYAIVTNKERNEVVVETADQLLNELDRPNVMVMVREIEHGHLLKKMLESRLGTTVPFLWGSTKNNSLVTNMEDYKAGKIKCMVVSTIFDEGVDIPNISSMIIASGGSSPIKSIQRVGRGIRRISGKDDVVIVDFMDEFHRITKNHSNKRIKNYLKEKNFQVTILRR